MSRLESLKKGTFSEDFKVSYTEFLEHEDEQIKRELPPIEMTDKDYDILVDFLPKDLSSVESIEVYQGLFSYLDSNVSDNYVLALLDDFFRGARTLHNFSIQNFLEEEYENFAVMELDNTIKDEDTKLAVITFKEDQKPEENTFVSDR